MPATLANEAPGWPRLRFTELGGVPLMINVLQHQGFAQALGSIDASAWDRPMAASAPWLAVWAHLAPATRERWVRDPMFAALPAFDALAGLPEHLWATRLLARWQTQPPALRRLGRQTWTRLRRACQTAGLSGPRALLQRPAWMQLNATHLDVLFSLDDVDLAVRRLGLDADPGWVPWLGRIVQLHFEPADQLPKLPHRSSP